jgi:Bardet-Biedl syndrome 9 protein
MSLFQAREWWATTSGADEEYDNGCVCVANADNDESGDAKIVTGSFQGTLRVFYPRQADFRIEDLVLEERLNAPILQIEAGRFIPNSNQLGIAVLHPRKLVVYSLQAMGGAGSSASYFELQKCYEHTLGKGGEHFTAYNMCYGSFGGAYGRDLICVQSMDAQLQVFEQDSQAFTRQLRSLVPGPLCYAPKIDAIITATTKLQVECYKYQMLASSTAIQTSTKFSSAEEKSQSSASISAAKQVQTDWMCNVGETVVEIRVGRMTKGQSSGQSDIIVLGEHSMFAINAVGGTLRMQHRLGYFPSCCYPFSAGAGSEKEDAGKSNHLLVATHDSMLKVYGGSKLLWASRCGAICVGLHVAKFGGIQGMIVTLSAEGGLAVNYLGTDPPDTTVGATESKELDYEEMDEEHRRLLQVIRESQSDSRMEPRDRVLLKAQVTSKLDRPGEGIDDDDFGAAGVVVARSEEGNVVQLTARLFVNYTGSDTLKNVCISLETPANVISRDSSILLPSLRGADTEPTVVPLTFRCDARHTPNSLKVRVVAAYSAPSSGEPRTAHCELDLPLALACQLVAPVKSNTFKFTIDTNRLPPLLSTLFNDMLSQPGITEDFVARVAGGGANVLSFQYYDGVEATILVSKNAGRYRVQSATLEALWLVSSELVRRLIAHYKVLSTPSCISLSLRAYALPLPSSPILSPLPLPPGRCPSWRGEGHWRRQQRALRDPLPRAFAVGRFLRHD